MRKYVDVYGNAALSAVFWCLVLLSTAAILWHADFVFGSEQFHMRYLCKGLAIPLMIDPAAGRAYPFTHCDCNFVLLLPGCLRQYIPQVLYAANAVIFLCTAYVMAKLTQGEGRGSLSLLSFVALVTAPGVLLVSCWNSYPEQRMIFLLGLFALAVFKGEERHSYAWYGVAGLSAAVLMCYKESAVVLIGAFVATLLGRWRRGDRPLRAFCISLCLLVVAYCVLYCVFIVCRTTSSYQASHKIGMLAALRFYLTQPEIALAFALALVRAVFFFTGRSGRHLVWDAMLFSATAFLGAYVVLQLTSPYRHYQTPVYVLLIPVYWHWLTELAKRSAVGCAIGVCLLLALVCQNVRTTVPQVLSVLRRRDSEIPCLRAVAQDPKVARVYYHHPYPGYFEDHLLRTFSIYYDYAGGTVPLETVKEVRTELSAEEVEIIPTCFGDVDLSVFEQADMRKTEWYAVVRGPYSGPAPRFCGPDGLTVRANEAGIVGLYGSGGGSALAGKRISVKVKLDERIRSKPLNAVLVAGAVPVPTLQAANHLTVRVGRDVVYRGPAAYAAESRNFVIPASYTDAPVITIELEADGVVRPVECGWSADKRRLGVVFESLALMPGES